MLSFPTITIKDKRSGSRRQERLAAIINRSERYRGGADPVHDETLAQAEREAAEARRAADEKRAELGRARAK
jgi:hypothetical protein